MNRLSVFILLFIIVASAFSQSPDTLYQVLVYTQNGPKSGFINREGKVVIESKYDFAKDFSEGLAFVKIDNSFFNWLCINTSGNVVFELNAVFVTDFNNGSAKFVDSTNERFFIDRTGNLISNPPEKPPKEIPVWNIFYADGKYGYVNYLTGDSLPAIYLKAGLFSEGLAPVFIKFKESDLPANNCYNAFINEKGDVIIKAELKFDDNGFMESGYFYYPGKWINGVCRFYNTNDPKTLVMKYLRRDGKVIW